ncbi:FAD-dependent oxidoreductase [Nocardioides litoris]|uniref:FAD-dependent oxidoreductase n=1 Tax=Nocardioides litoris TaxID=1926648 RepID=UPI00111C9EC7|nr:FAD-dependent oxidoreductase [Nocardioides litoris]
MTRPTDRTRVVVAGLGESGLLTARHLDPRRFEVVGVSSKPLLVSGQGLGHRLAWPEQWARDHLVPFDRYRRLDHVCTVHAELVGLDLATREVLLRRPDGSPATEPYDVLVVATGVTNGFWRRPGLQTRAEVEAQVRADHERLAAAGSVAVVGGGAAAVSSAVNLARAHPGARVDLYFPGERGLPLHHDRVWDDVARRASAAGTRLHPGHRAVVPDAALDALGTGPVAFSTGQDPAPADVVVWAVGRVRPNTGWLPSALLDEQGYVRSGRDLRVPGHEHVYAVGDCAATDPLRSSARNRADKQLAHNIAAALDGRPLRRFPAARRRWGEVLGPQPDGLTIHDPRGRGWRIPRPVVDRVLDPVVVRRVIWGGVRPPS